MQEAKKIQGVLKTASAPVMSGKLMFFNSSGSGRGLFDVEEDKVVILTHRDEMGHLKNSKETRRVLFVDYYVLASDSQLVDAALADDLAFVELFAVVLDAQEARGRRPVDQPRPQNDQSSKPSD